MGISVKPNGLWHFLPEYAGLSTNHWQCRSPADFPTQEQTCSTCWAHSEKKSRLKGTLSAGNKTPNQMQKRLSQVFPVPSTKLRKCGKGWVGRQREVELLQCRFLLQRSVRIGRYFPPKYQSFYCLTSPFSCCLLHVLWSHLNSKPPLNAV